MGPPTCCLSNAICCQARDRWQWYLTRTGGASLAWGGPSLALGGGRPVVRSWWILSLIGGERCPNFVVCACALPSENTGRHLVWRALGGATVEYFIVGRSHPTTGYTQIVSWLAAAHCMELLTAWCCSLHGVAHCMKLTAWSRSLHGATHCMELLTAWSRSLHGHAHCMVLLTAWTCSLHGAAHCMEPLTAWCCSLHGAAHCMELLTAWTCSLHGAAHCMVLLTALNCSLQGHAHWIEQPTAESTGNNTVNK